LLEKLSPLQINAKTRPEIAVSAAEFLLEGMYAHKRLSRTEERSFSAGEKKSRLDEATRYAEKMREREGEREDYATRSRTRRGFN
jgi:magnesium chelatase subunit I